MASQSEKPLPRHHQDHLRILAFGDSLTEGYTDFGTRFHPYGKIMRTKLAELLPNVKVSVDIEGQSGDCVLSSLDGDFQHRLTTALQTPSGEPPKYDLAIVLGGTNDLAYKLEAGLVGAEEIFRGLGTLYEQILNAGTSLIAMTVPERAIDTRSSGLAVRARANREHLNRWIVEWTRAERRKRRDSGVPKVYTFDLAPLVPFPKDKSEDDETPFDETVWSPDGLHMSASGYDFVGTQLASFIKDIV